MAILAHPPKLYNKPNALSFACCNDKFEAKRDCSSNEGFLNTFKSALNRRIWERQCVQKLIRLSMFALRPEIIPPNTLIRWTEKPKTAAFYFCLIQLYNFGGWARIADLFLRTELLVESARLIPLRDALDRLEFTVIASAQNYQFARKMEQGDQVWDIKVDLLAKPPDTQRFPQIKMDSRRIKPHPSVGIHAHRTNEAIAIEDEAASLTLSGFRSSGEAYTGTVFLPSTYALLLMKLFALRDQVDAENKGFGRKHALDLYTLVAILTEPEYEQTKTLRERYQHTEEAKDAARIVSTLFADESTPGMRRLRENELLPSTAGLNEFRELLHEFFS